MPGRLRVAAHLNRQSASERANLASVTAELAKEYGKDAQKMTQQVAQEAGMSVQQLKQLAGSHPKAVLKMFKSSASKPAGGMDSSQNPGTPLPTGADLHGLPKPHSVRPPSMPDGAKPRSNLRAASKADLLEEWNKSYPEEAVAQMRKTGQI